jgi:peptidyl-prolyl cis-trans isomerase C
LRSLILIFLGITACNPDPTEIKTPGLLESTGEVVFTVNGMTVTETMVEAITRRVPPDQLAQMKAQGQYEQFLQRMALGQVLYQKAVEQELYKDAGVQDALAMSDRETLATEMLNSIGEASVTDEAVVKMYEERAVQYARPQVHARHILVKELALADDLAKQLREGADFAALAATHSKDPGSGKRGGDLGWFDESKMLKPFAEVAFSSKVNEISDPVETRFGFHVIQVMESRDKTPLDDVRPALEQELKQKAVEKYMTDLQANLKFEMAASKDASAAKPPVEPETKPPTEAEAAK